MHILLLLQLLSFVFYAFGATVVGLLGGIRTTMYNLQVHRITTCNTAVYATS